MAKQIIKILFIAIGIIGFIYILYGCTLIKNTGEYPNKFIIKEKNTKNDYVYYFDEDEQYYIYHKKDRFKKNDTIYIKSVLFGKYLKLKKK